MAIALFSFFWNAILPQFEVITLHALGTARDTYSRVRLWGSIGFIIAVLSFGYVFERKGIEWFPMVMLMVIVSIVICSAMRFEDPPVERMRDGIPESFWDQLLRPAILVFFAASFLLHLSHGAYYTYFSIYLAGLGHHKTYIGLLWSLGVIAEVILFVYMHRWFRVSTVASIMCVALFLTALRWFLIALYAESDLVMFFAQVLHAMSFGAMHAAAIHFVHLAFSSRFQGRAQALYSSLGFGLGGAVGAILSGILVDRLGYQASFLVSSLLAIAAMVLVFKARDSLSKASASR